jgi:single-strand DNA-binding protein
MANESPAGATATNEVRLVGRLTTVPEERELPSGALIAVFRVSVPRLRTPMNQPAPKGVDWVDCVAAGARCRRSLAGWSLGDQVEVHGVLRRRFFRSDTGSPTRLEVEVLRARRASGGRRG